MTIGKAEELCTQSALQMKESPVITVKFNLQSTEYCAFKTHVIKHNFQEKWFYQSLKKHLSCISSTYRMQITVISN